MMVWIVWFVLIVMMVWMVPVKCAALLSIDKFNGAGKAESSKLKGKR
jgi:hypothetical protein